MPIEIKLTYLRAGTNGCIATLNHMERQWFVPFHSILLDVSLDYQGLFDALLTDIEGTYVIKPGFENHSGKKAFPFSQLEIVFKKMAELVKQEDEKFCLRPHHLKSLLKELLREKLITELDASAYYNLMPVTNTIEDKKIQCITEQNAQLALDIAETEKQLKNESLVWLIKAYEYDPKNTVLIHQEWLTHFISDIPLTEFEELFNKAELPFWLMKAKSQSQHSLENKSEPFSRIFDSLCNITNYLVLLNELCEQTPKHPLFIATSILTGYVEHLDNDAFIQLLMNDESYGWLLDALSASINKRTITLSFKHLNDEVMLNALIKYLSQTKAKVDFKFLPLAMQDTTHTAYISLILKALNSCRAFEMLDLSDLQIQDSGLNDLINGLPSHQLIFLKTLIICNCGISSAIIDSLSSFISKCHDLKTITISGNCLTEKDQTAINELLRQNSPAEFMRGICTSHSSGSIQSMLFEDENKLISDDLFIEQSENFILIALNECLYKLAPVLGFIPSDKYKEIHQLTEAFTVKPSLGNFKNVLEKLVYSTWRDKQGLTDSFVIFIEKLEMDSEAKLRLFSIIKQQLGCISNEKKIDLSQAVVHIEIFLQLQAHCKVISTI